MKNINILHKIKGRIRDFHDLHLPLLRFVTDGTVGFLDNFL